MQKLIEAVPSFSLKIVIFEKAIMRIVSIPVFFTQSINSCSGKATPSLFKPQEDLEPLEVSWEHGFKLELTGVLISSHIHFAFYQVELTHSGTQSFKTK